ncbi:hypothetical protein [Lewinella sp. 4G2]|uniref:hypothetical protein n=1 Tax=Lewinella sp. 4G2 TaxID=1803372 RepID=UPI0007B48011|nr:hypothetical protein [Lewinella sp. 4G2]OAV46153.1 hypothetical protein A3850_018000 [Lewinella sp. 4G2]
MKTYRTSSFLLLLLATLWCGTLSAQVSGRNISTFGQEVPPFLREKPASRTYEVQGKKVTIPSFQLKGFTFPPSFVDREDFIFGWPNNLPVLNGLRGQQFSYTQTLPHLAFFCRLEINESMNYVIPAKFRLGGHSHWQDNLLRDR